MSAHIGNLLRLDRVDAGYDGTVVLRDVSLEVNDNQFSAVVGPSGAGKTTLLRLLLGTVKPSAGAVHRRDGLRTAYVPQLETVNWDFPLTVFECVLMGRTTRSALPWPSREERAEVGRLLERLGIGHLQRRHIRELSGGQQQRMFLARALIRRPHLLVLDEPTSGVDANTRHDILHLLADLHVEGIAIILTTHDLNGMAAHLPHLVCVKGTIIAQGGPSDVITPDVLEQTYGARMEVLRHLDLPLVVDPRVTLATAG
ncbi:metal ABC transporter ATP-binding protein [Dactylosporangium aurantiacum]|uniref:Metal ABC transporter ATP-binding protein n=1 Tax=Dactylosporangium aurantiacum TaxID=35754 RepID=A0A9Q9MIB7_9ACTN|nr:metal ABC transporter ATP-binding protein [Dactylosporangium aurantiacum]MDG6106659.1 metal ABC transporter ATP-binding protein [Dactylosporangium aurantiacum]UWZ50817.1 metal ABC transporter ATP-binding protein [Dactylosporangium aurantiacum]